MRSATAEVAASTPPNTSDGEVSPNTSDGEVLRRADGIELIGEFADSGFQDPPLLARRSDGQVVQLSKLLYAVAEASDGRRDAQAVGSVVSQRCGRTVSANDVAFLADRKLRPLGVLTLPDGRTPMLKKRPPVMALRHRKPLLSEAVVNAGTRAFTWLHRPFVQIAVVLGVAAFDVWLFGIHGIAGGLRSALYNPVLLLAVVGSVVVATAFHEFGHASACRYGGARPGVMGVGLYLVWPVFYCDVTDAYRLDRAGRLRTDLGGIYFNAVFALLAGAVFLVTGEEAALLAAVVQHLLILQQLIPLMRFDGYYVLTDLTGVPDILSRIKPIFRSLVRGREREPRVAELKPWVRLVVTAYLVTLVPALLLLFTWMIIATPRLLATIHDSFALQLNRIHHAGAAEVAAGAVRTAILGLQLGAMSLSLGRTGGMAGRGVFRWSRGSAPRTAVAAMGAATLLGAVGYILWPNGDYRPIQPGERGTVQGGLRSLAKVPGGRPSLSSERSGRRGRGPGERALGGESGVRLRRERHAGPGRSPRGNERHAGRGDTQNGSRGGESDGTGTGGDGSTGTSTDGTSTQGPTSSPSGTSTSPTTPSTSPTTPSTGSTTTGPEQSTSTTPTTTNSTPTTTDTTPPNTTPSTP